MKCVYSTAVQLSDIFPNTYRVYVIAVWNVIVLKGKFVQIFWEALVTVLRQSW
jgi:hypothetical protein